MFAIKIMERLFFKTEMTGEKTRCQELRVTELYRWDYENWTIKMLRPYSSTVIIVVKTFASRTELYCWIRG